MEDLKSPATQEPRIMVAVNITVVLGLTATALRFLCRIKSGAGLWWDDWLCFVASIWNFVGWILYLTMIRHFVGHHIGTIDVKEFGSMGGAYFYGQVAYPVILTLAKLSILALYWRIFARAARWPIIIAVIAALIIGIAWVCVFIFQCHPIQQAWELLTPNRQCIESKYIVTYPPIPSIIEDAIIMLIPLPYIFRLQMRLTQKILVSSVFVVGSFLVVISILRLVLVHNIREHDKDETWNTVDVLIWTCVEENLATFCACMPALRPLFTFVKTGSFVGTTKASTLGGIGTGGSSQKRGWPSAFSQSQSKQRSWQMSSMGGRDSIEAASDSDPIVDQHITVTKQWDVEYKANA